MAGYADIIGHDHIIAHHGVMGHMGICHDQAVVADPRDHTAILGARIDGDRLPDGAVLADLQAGVLAMKLEVLRLVADRGEREDAGPRANGRVAFHHGVGDEFYIVAQRNLWPHDAVGPNSHPGPELSAVSNDGRRVNERSAHEGAPTIIAVISASAMIVPLTLAFAS